MDEQNVFILSDNRFNQSGENVEARPPGNQNNCQGHKAAMDAGGQGHWYGDSCSCDLQPSVSIDQWIYPSIGLTILLIVLLTTKLAKLKS